jgi:hypothetical protein
MATNVGTPAQFQILEEVEGIDPVELCRLYENQALIVTACSGR